MEMKVEGVRNGGGNNAEIEEIKVDIRELYALTNLALLAVENASPGSVGASLEMLNSGLTWQELANLPPAPLRDLR